MVAKILDATLIGASLRLRPYYEQIPLRDITVSASQRHQVDQDFCNAVLVPSMDAIGCVEAIGVRIVHGKVKYELIYGIQRWFSCETKLADAERALQLSDIGARSSQRIEYERWVEIPCKVYAAETTDAQVKMLQTASNMGGRGTKLKVKSQTRRKPARLGKEHLVICETLQNHPIVTKEMLCVALNQALNIDLEAKSKSSHGGYRHPVDGRVSELCTATKFGDIIVERYDSATRTKLYRLTAFGREYYNRQLDTDGPAWRMQVMPAE
jgi:hypothetical protein